MLLNHFQVSTHRTVIATHTDKKGGIKETEKQIANSLPLMCGFAAKIGVNEHTLLKWSKDPDKPEFCTAYKKAKMLQKNMLVQNGMENLYNAPFTIFVAKNITDMTNDERLKVDADINLTVSIENEE